MPLFSLKKAILGGKAILAAGLLARGAESLIIQLPQETRTFKPGPGFEIANAQCLICHSEDYVAIQPALPRTFWKSNVQKMQQKYGAPIPDNQIDPLVSYLATTYGADKTSASKASTSGTTETKEPSAILADTSSAAGGQLAAKFGCLSCHSPEKKIVGPPLKEIATKYKGQADAFEKVSRQITKGGGGQWGPIPMPPFPQLSGAEVRALSEWVLGH
jgi:cytochrome c551/c552